MQHFKGKGVESKTTTQYAQDILLKCHQSEANIEEQLTEIVCSQYTRAEKAEARIKELEKQIHDMASGDVIREARADQNKKIGDALKQLSEPPDTQRWDKLIAFIAKLQKGESPE